MADPFFDALPDLEDLQKEAAMLGVVTSWIEANRWPPEPFDEWKTLTLLAGATANCFSRISDILYDIIHAYEGQCLIGTTGTPG